MKIIHTSDWHLGQQLFDYDRSEEQRDFLRQLRDRVAAEQPDALLVSGDVFHYCSPSASAQRLYTDALVALHETCPSMQIVIRRATTTAVPSWKSAATSGSMPE